MIPTSTQKMMKREQSLFDLSQIMPFIEMEKKKNSRFYACLWKEEIK